MAVCVSQSAAIAENWSRFRGPNGQGRSAEKGIPAAWTENDLAWKIELGGEGHSSPVVWEDKVFVTFANEDTGDRTLMAVRASDGETMWKKGFTMEPPSLNKLNHPAAGTPAVDADTVYTIWYGADRTVVVAVDHEGGPKWKKEFAPVHSRHGGGTSPVVFDDMVVFTLEQEENEKGLESCWYALDRRDGSVRWRLERENSGSISSSTPCVYRAENGEDMLIFTSLANGITAVDPDSGTVVWSAAESLPVRVNNSPVLAGDLIIGACGRGGSGIQLTALRPPSGGSSDPEIVYSIREKFIPNVSTSIYVGGRLFMFHDKGDVTCLDSETGSVVWTGDPGGKFFGSPILVEDRIYCINMDGQVVVIRAADKYDMLAVNDLGEASQTTPAVANGRMILRTLSHLYCVAAR